MKEGCPACPGRSAPMASGVTHYRRRGLRLVFSFIFAEYSEPKVVVGIFGTLAIAAAITA